VDLRSEDEFSSDFIRDSYCFDVSRKNSWLGLIEHLKRSESKAFEFEKKYGSKRIRRICLIPKAHSQEDYEQAFKLIVDVCESNDIDLDKVYMLTDSIPTFKLKFGFLCINNEVRKSLKNPKEIEMAEKDQFNDNLKQLMYSFSRFPFILIETQLLLGTTFNMNNKGQMEDLGVKSIIKFDMYKIVKGEEVEANTTLERGQIEGKEGLTIMLNAQKYIDFNGIVEAIRELPTPRLLCCAQNMTISANFAIACFMEIQKIDVNKASLLVFSKLGTTEVEKMIYSQLMMHQTSSNFKKI
jgi:hypothetical protein